MPINYRIQFITDIGFPEDAAIPYINNNTAMKRISAIYGTARVGRLSVERSFQFWHNFFSNIWNNRNDIPIVHETFNDWHKEKTMHLSALLGENNLLKVGIAQKMLNLFLKDFWAWQEIPNEVVIWLYIPLDRIILGKFANIPKTWKSWTKVKCDEHTFEDRYGEYMTLQDVMRDYFNEVGIFQSLIEMEQFLWHQI